ncbi:MAG: TonB-dependent receptor [Prevotellaceae bacterium]|jgi:hypothetical protein|nr:TonB-dependent receptor [Prevotellaceae bacterium]
MYDLINTFDPETGKFYLENTPEARKEFLSRYAYANTDWFKVLFRNSLVQDHSISISSGTKNSNSYSSISYMNDNGWSLADKVQRLTANLRNNYNITDKLTVGILLNGSVRKQDAPGTVGRVSNVVNGGYERDFDINPFSYAINTSRALTPYDENGNLEFFTRNYADFNILHELRNNKIKISVVDVKARVDLKYDILPGLIWDFLGAARYVKSNREHEIHESSNMAEAYRAADNSTMRKNNKFLYTDPNNPEAEPQVVLPYGGFYNTYDDIMTNFDIRNSISYSKELGKHTFSVFGGQQIKYADRQRKSVTGNGYQYDKGGTVMQDFRYFKQMIENNYYNFSMGTTRDRFVAFYLNADYVFDKKYVLAVTGRYDGSNAMGRKRSARWFPTWTIGGKWNAGEEQVIKDVPWISELGLRVSYGLTGSMAPYANSSVVYLGTVSNRARGEEFESYIDLDALENSELTWEKSYSFNAGIDLNLFKNRIRFSFDVWQRKNFDLIDNIKVSGIGGKTRKYANYADMKSSGIDVSLTGRPIVFKDFEWISTLSLGTNNTDITRAEYKPRIVDMIRSDGGNLQGYPVNSLFSLQYVKLSEEGIPEFINENGEVSSNVYLQSTNLGYLKYEGTIDPKVTGGFSNTL